jgi:hypothetical protein
VSRHDTWFIASALLMLAGYAAGIWTGLILPRIRRKPRHKETDHG